MDQKYSKEFFKNFLTSLRENCKSSINFSHTIEVTGYICVEIDRSSKERFVLSETICGNIVSESYCTKTLRPIPLIIQNKKIEPKIENDETLEMSPQCGKDRVENSTENTENTTDLGLRISSVSSLAKPEKGVTIKSPIDEVGSLSSGGESGIALKSESNDISENADPVAWEGRDTFVCTFSKEKTSEAGGHNDINGQSKERASSIANSIWQQPLDNRNQDLDQILNQGANWSLSEVVPSFSQSLDFAVKPGEPDNDLAVLSNEYFTAQMLAHTSKALDPSLQQDVAGPSTGGTGRSGSSKSKFSALENILKSPGVPGLEADSSESKTVLVIDEDSDEVIEVDMSSDEDVEMIQERDADTEEQMPKVLSAEEEEKQRRRYKSSLKYQRYAVKLFNDFQKNRGEIVRPIQTMHPEKLDAVLADFYGSLRKNNGEEFGFMSLRNVQSHLERHLRDASYPFSITKDPRFRHSKQTLMNKIAMARARAKKYPEQSTLINDDDINLLFESGELGAHCPDTLLNTMWFMNSMFMQIRLNTEHFELKWGDIGLYETNYGQEVLECYYGRSKGRRIYCDADEPEQCYVTLYKKYRDKRPASAMGDDSPFYLTPLRSPANPACWYSSEKPSISRITGVFKKMAASAGLEGKRLP